MTKAIFQEWLVGLNAKMLQQHRHVLLFIDNCPSHCQMKLSNVKIVFYPKNMTGKVQVLDLGIIANFKVFYRRELVNRLIDQIEKCKNAYELASKINVYEAIVMICLAWRKVTESTIKHYFQKAGHGTVSRAEAINYMDELTVPQNVRRQIG